ncbi:MAG TPA: inositol monophosphatase family protein [Nitrospirota bacterium]|nr:inositol monophosphatase family protein [Nitrospirota bacterium]
MNTDAWLKAFKDIGSQMHDELPKILSIASSNVPLGRGAGGDKTYPIDKWAEDIIISALEKIYDKGESFTVISEELGVRAFGEGENIVLIDPIDGSNNAKSGFPSFSTSLALLNGNKMSDLTVAYVMNLATEDTFWAARGAGAYKSGVQIKTSPTETLTIAAFEASTPSRDLPPIMPILNTAKRVRCLGSTALDLAYLASSAISVFITAMPSRTFDYAAGMLIVQEAGGIITDLTGKTLDHVLVGLDRTVPLLASANRKLHTSVLKILSQQELIKQ